MQYNVNLDWLLYITLYSNNFVPWSHLTLLPFYVIFYKRKSIKVTQSTYYYHNLYKYQSILYLNLNNRRLLYFSSTISGEDGLHNILLNATAFAFLNNMCISEINYIFTHWIASFKCQSILLIKCQCFFLTF